MRTLAGLRTELADFVAGFEVEGLSAPEAEGALADAAGIVNLAQMIQTLAAGRVAESVHWKRRGHRSAAEWLAARTKSSVGDAIGMVETAGKLRDCPGIEAQARAGELTGAQTRALTAAVSADPSAETALMQVAKVDGLSKLKERCRAVEHAAAGDAEARYARIHRQRSLRHWTDSRGAFCLSATLTPDAGAVVLGALEPFERGAFARGRTDGRTEPREAYAADALVALAETSIDPTRGPGDGDGEHPGGAAGRSDPVRHSRKPSFTVLVDARVLARGRVEAGETCEIPGVGPVPVSVLRQYAGDAVWHALVTDGHDVRTYASLTRHIPTPLRVALEARDRECVVPGCNTTRGLEIDHTTPLEAGGPTTYANLARACHHHHAMKHQEGWILAGGPGRWTFTPGEPGPAPDGLDPP